MEKEMNSAQSQGSLVVIIGGGGMGLAIARRLAHGSRILVGDASDSARKAFASTLRQAGFVIEEAPVDVSDWESVEELASVAASWGRVDTVVHTAGVSPVTATTELIYKVDLLGTAHVIEAFLPLARPGVSLICIASMAGHFARLSPELERHLATAPLPELLVHQELGIDTEPPQSAYMIAKRGNQLRVQAAATTWGQKGARVNSISPGVVATEMGQSEMAGENGGHIRSLIDGSASGRVGTPEDIAAAVAFLAGPESSYLTGTDLLVDGGVMAGLMWGGRRPSGQ